ncbi:MAG: thiamine S protein [Methanomicrobiaceae archaeon]|nr:thiamine S protein [Methanomicrobiaceae archaeon]
MKCKVRIKRQSKDLEYEFTGGEKLSDMLLSIGLIPDTVIVFKDGIPVPEDEYITGDKYVIAETASRG